MSNNIRIIFILLTSIFLSIGLAQLPGNSGNQVRQLYEALEFDEAITSGQNLLDRKIDFSKESLITIHQYMALSFYNLGKIDSARSHFLSLLSIDPAFELDPIKVSPKIISFFKKLKQETPSQPPENAVGYTKYIFMEDLRPGATFRSLILPGWGQFYKHQNKKGYIIGSAFIASLTATGISLYLEEKNHDKYLESTTLPAIEKNYQTYNDWFKRRKIFMVSTISIWAIAVLDALRAPYPHSEITFDNNSFSVSINMPLGK